MPVLPAGPIFVSYSRRDDEVMRRIAFFLRDKGYKVWVDNEKLIPGTTAWEEAIESAIREAFAVVVVLSPDSKNSEWVRREITYADQFEKRVFPVLVKGTEELSLPLRLVTRQYVDLRKDEEAGLQSLDAAIHFYIEEKQTLEMKRPSRQKEVVNTPPSDPRSENFPVPSSRVKRPYSWVSVLGIFSALCILCAGVSWFGYRALSPWITTEQPESIDPVSTMTLIIPETALETPSPTATEVSAEPAPDILAEYLDDVEVTHVETFDDPAGTGWRFDNGEIIDGVLEIPGDPNYYGAAPEKIFSVGEGAVIDFTYPEDVGFEIYLSNGDYNSSQYKRFGIFVSTDVIYVNAMEGPEKIGGGFEGDLEIQPGTRYSLLIARLPDAEFLQVLWNTDDPSQRTANWESMDSSWMDVDMDLYLGNGEGIAYIDRYQEITFSGVK